MNCFFWETKLNCRRSLVYCFHYLEDFREDDYSYSEDDEFQNDIAWNSEYYHVIEEEKLYWRIWLPNTTLAAFILMVAFDQGVSC